MVITERTTEPPIRHSRSRLVAIPRLMVCPASASKTWLRWKAQQGMQVPPVQGLRQEWPACNVSQNALMDTRDIGNGDSYCPPRSAHTKKSLLGLIWTVSFGTQQRSFTRQAEVLSWTCCAPTSPPPYAHPLRSPLHRPARTLTRAGVPAWWRSPPRSCSERLPTH